MSFIYSILTPPLRATLTWLSKRALPQTEGTISLPGLSASVEIIRDQWGVPHIYASEMNDLFFAQGFVHAQDRLWQMELNRRTANGCLSEVLGVVALDTDRFTRTFGFARLGRADWANTGPEVREVIQAYSEGVNAFLKNTKRLPVEFTLLGFRPEPWTPEDSTAFSRVMIWQLSHAWYGEIVRAQLIQAVGSEHASELEIHYPQNNPVVLPRGIDFNRLDPNGRLLKMPGPFLDRGKGSNAWVVTGNKSVTGHAMLCNDMHLALGLPSIWYEAHLVAKDFQVTGVTLPGLPLVLVGHNADIAWGCTLAFTDCEDLFVERIDPRDLQRYQYQGEWREAEVITEEIKVKGRAEPHVEKVVVTHHGPIISDVVGYPEQRVAVNSMALRPCPALTGWFKLNCARSWDEFVEAMRLIEAPQLNFAFADVVGNIGYWVAGKVPLRAKGDGTIPAPGWDGEHEWVGEVPFEEMPHALNPAQGYLVNTNNRIISNDYPHWLGNVWMNGYRARRITDVLESKDRLTTEDFRALHVDFTCLPGKEFVALLEGISSSDKDVQLALERLRAWDGILNTYSVGGTIYEVARYALVRNLLEPGLGEVLTTRFMGQGFHPLLFIAHEFYGHDTTTLFRLLDNPNSWWVQQAGGRQQVITRSLEQAVEWLRAELGEEVEGWQWGNLHRAIFPHALGLQKPLDRIFNRGPLPIGGDTDTPCQTAMNPGDPYDNKSWSPTFRMIAEPADWSRSLVCVPPGQSGQLGSLHYDDNISQWVKGDYHPMLWTRAEVDGSLAAKLALVNI